MFLHALALLCSCVSVNVSPLETSCVGVEAEVQRGAQTEVVLLLKWAWVCVNMFAFKTS